MHDQIKVKLGQGYQPTRFTVRTPTGEYRALRPYTGHLCDVRSTANDRMWDRLVFFTAAGGGLVVLVLAAVGVIV